MVEIRLVGGEAIECLVDTGFDGGLVLPRDFADQLQLPIRGSMTFEMVGGVRMLAQVGLVHIEWLDQVRKTEVIVSESNDALIGTELLTGTTLHIDYVSRAVRISNT